VAEDKPPSCSTTDESPPALTRDEVTARKRRIAERSRTYPYRQQTNLSLVVLSFNHRARIGELLRGIRRTCAEEVIVCEDGSWDGSLEEWDRALDRRNDLLLRSNDLHEIRAYDRAIHLASAPIVCLLQDDDQLPADGGWAAEALGLFAADPQLAIVSGYFGWLGGPYGMASVRHHHGIPWRSPRPGHRPSPSARPTSVRSSSAGSSTRRSAASTTRTGARRARHLFEADPALARLARRLAGGPIPASSRRRRCQRDPRYVVERRRARRRRAPQPTSADVTYGPEA
jgi:hypothetical protein